MTENGKKTYVGLVLDETGSMSACRDQAIAAFNEQIATLRKHAADGGETLASLWYFSDVHDKADRIREKHLNVAPDAIADLDRSTYNPDGNTPLFDAIGYAISKLEPFDAEGDVGILVVIVSDGEENASREWTNEAICERVKALEATGRWTFAYIGANWDLADVHKHLGINKGNIAAYAATPQGTQAMGSTTANAMAGYMGGRAMGMMASTDYWAGADTATPGPEPEPTTDATWQDDAVKRALKR